MPYNNLVIDAHCDTISQIYNHNESITENSFHVDLRRIRENYEKYIQVFAVFAEEAPDAAQAFFMADKMIDRFYSEMMHAGKLSLCLDSKDIADIESNGGIGAILALEGGKALNGDLDNLLYFYEKGVRILSLTWNQMNDLACGVMDASGTAWPDSKKGLSDLGKMAIEKMNELGILLDVSHLSDEGFFQVCAITKKPFIASHSNSRKICRHIRNLTDEQILCIKNAGGVIGINLNPEFLNSSGRADINDIIRHVEHIAALAGEDHIGLGTDFDGICSTPESISGVEDLYIIFNRLLQLNYSENFVRKFSALNFKRLFSSVFR